MKSITTRIPYTPPIWARDILVNAPKHGRLSLANLPTPLHLLSTSNICKESNSLEALSSCQFYIKHDDATGGAELGGNKIRKLEFLLADALAQEYEHVITIGGEQSNHCRATACACRKVGLTPHLILRSKRKKDDSSSTHFGWIGNILFDRMVGSHIYVCSPGEYGRFGSMKLIEHVSEIIQMRTHQQTYNIPVGGSNAIGTWGYIEAVEELLSQWYNDDNNEQQIESPSSNDKGNIDHIVFATGSGGTATGIVLGIALAYKFKQLPIPQMHAIGVCDDPNYFYQTMANIAKEMGFTHQSTISPIEFFQEHVTVYQGKGLGYASSTREELDFVTDFARSTGVALDPVYTGKALYHFVTHVLKSNPDKFQDSNILFWHTGGALGMYDKGESLTLEHVSPVEALELYGSKSL